MSYHRVYANALAAIGVAHRPFQFIVLLGLNFDFLRERAACVEKRFLYKACCQRADADGSTYQIADCGLRIVA
jgi:hypothetical protein